MDIHDAVSAVRPPFRLQRPGENHWSIITLGRSGFHLAMLLTPRNRSIAIELAIRVPWKERAFAALEKQKDAIEAELGSPLKWLLMPDKNSARIVLERDLDPSVPENREEVKR